MAVIRNPTDLNNPVNYVATFAFFCCISCVILMLRFKFKAILNISSPNNNHAEVPTVSISGGYRPQREEYFGITSSPDSRVKITPAMVKLSMNDNKPPMRPSKSTNDLNRTDFKPVTSSKSTPDVSHDPMGNNNISNNVQLRNPEKTPKELKKEEKERKKLEKKRIAEKRAKRKAAQDRAKLEAKKAQDQAKIEAKKAQARAKIEAKKTQDNAKIEAKNAKLQTKTKIEENKQKPPVASSSGGVPIPQAPAGPSGHASTPNRREVVSTISIQSDFNRNSGPPPYSETPISEKNVSDNTGNTSFSKPIDSSSSWDMISQHRQQISRPNANIEATSRKQVVMDLQYKRGNDSDPDNSEA